MKNIRRIVFFGTHELAVSVLSHLQSLELAPALVVTRSRVGLEPGPFEREDEDPPPHPVKRWANAQGIDIFTSEAGDEAELAERLTALKPDLLVVANYGSPLPPSLIGTAAKGAVQVHGGALPKYRGPHPLLRAISAGEKKVNATIFVPDEEPWGGGIFANEEVELEENDTFEVAYSKVETVALELLSDALGKVDKAKKDLKTRKQTTKGPIKIPKLTTRHRRAPWHLESSSVYDRLRAHSPPGLFTSCRLQSFEIISGRVLKLVEAPYGESGTYLGIRAGCLAVLCGRQSAFGIEEVQRNGETFSASEAADSLGISVGDLFV